MRSIAKFVTLYLALVLTSGVIICLALDTHWLAALGTASVGCLFKTLAASVHAWAWSNGQDEAVTAPVYDVELVTLPVCPERQAA